MTLAEYRKLFPGDVIVRFVKGDQSAVYRIPGANIEKCSGVFTGIAARDLDGATVNLLPKPVESVPAYPCFRFLTVKEQKRRKNASA